jgi:hypothetical protein
MWWRLRLHPWHKLRDGVHPQRCYLRALRERVEEIFLRRRYGTHLLERRAHRKPQVQGALVLSVHAGWDLGCPVRNKNAGDSLEA